MIETTVSEILYQLEDIYSIWGCCWNVITYKWKVHNGKHFKYLLCRKVSFLTVHQCQFRVVSHGMKQI